MLLISSQSTPPGVHTIHTDDEDLLDAGEILKIFHARTGENFIAKFGFELKPLYLRCNCFIDVEVISIADVNDVNFEVDPHVTKFQVVSVSELNESALVVLLQLTS
jgi:hypothetical protein